MILKQTIGAALGMSLLAVGIGAVNAADLEWEGSVESSCSLIAGQTGQLALSQDGFNLSSQEDGGRSAQVSYENLGNWKLVARGVNVAYAKDGASITSDKALDIAFGNGPFEVLKDGSSYGTRSYNIIPPSGVVDVDVRIRGVSAIGDQTFEPGLYSVRQTITCEAR